MDLVTISKIGIVLISLPHYVINQEDKDAQIIVNKNSFDNNAYNYEFETDNGIRRIESGSIENGVWTVRGKIFWTGPDSVRYGYEYVADDKGYRQTEVTNLLSPLQPPLLDNRFGSSPETDQFILDIPESAILEMGIDKQSAEGLLGG